MDNPLVPLKRYVGQKHQMTTKQQHNNRNFECLYSVFANHNICVVLQSSVCHVNGWNYPKFMLKSKYGEILDQALFNFLGERNRPYKTPHGALDLTKILNTNLISYRV